MIRLEFAASYHQNEFHITLVEFRDFHAYLGYESTHNRGIEADQARMSGVRTAHILGTFSLHVIANTNG